MYVCVYVYEYTYVYMYICGYVCICISFFFLQQLEPNKYLAYGTSEFNTGKKGASK